MEVSGRSFVQETSLKRLKICDREHYLQEAAIKTHTETKLGSALAFKQSLIGTKRPILCKNVHPVNRV